LLRDSFFEKSDLLYILRFKRVDLQSFCWLACSSIHFCFFCASSSSSFCFLAPSFLPLHYTARNFHHPEIVVISHQNTAFLGVRGRRVTYSNYETPHTNHLGTHSQWKLDEKTWEKERSKQKAQSLKENQHQTS
jgi:hypothetical protein